MRHEFTDVTIAPIDILKELIPCVEENFLIPEITISQTREIIAKSKNSNSTGYDYINNKILKKINNIIAPFYNTPYKLYITFFKVSI